MKLKYLHTMIRVKDLEKTMAFFALLGLKNARSYFTSEIASSSRLTPLILSRCAWSELSTDEAASTLSRVDAALTATEFAIDR